jgi:NTP pyrophosphatase (non-canonical NTP hydrolase)
MDYDKEKTIYDLKELVREFCEARDWTKYHDPKSLATAMSIESSEVLEHFLWKSEDQLKTILDDENKKQEVAEELADTFWYMLRFAQLYEIDLSYELERKRDINEERFPIGKSERLDLKK